MESENLKLKKLKNEQKSKSNKNKLLDSYIDSSKNMEDKIAVVKLKNSVDKSAFISSIRQMMKSKWGQDLKDFALEKNYLFVQTDASFSSTLLMSCIFNNSLEKGRLAKFFNSLNLSCVFKFHALSYITFFLVAQDFENL